MSREREVLEADVVGMFTAVAEATGDEVEVRDDLAVPHTVQSTIVRSTVPKVPSRYLPGTYLPRYLLNANPHLV